MIVEDFLVSPRLDHLFPTPMAMTQMVMALQPSTGKPPSHFDDSSSEAKSVPFGIGDLKTPSGEDE